MPEQSWSGAEALKIAIGIEQDGLEFYTHAAERAASREARELFRGLAKDERQHLETLEREIRPALESGDWGWSDNELIEAYLRSIERPEIFPGERGGAGAERVEDDLEAIQIGIEAEKNSIKYYTTMAEQTAHAGGRQAFARLVQEEKAHLEMLFGARQHLIAQE
ncbi:hypothetical protein AMJ71_05650 [candidate division TA06 bacterium SM1_40]|uniref:Rubrerythrin diiron-binding domain-containing protein n=2 Tax=Bacteria division TA06 TaxID=1156500 RepID=A0A0S8JM28_UNCT6|nr:MAG: hypothetical protein AMJ82_09100 [candidate division TA06 bacterium SM23_40]KPL09726.1 MAG: hypothetical protein AMJ71_05650 [candidate division TA06 bacterium SM1_40]